VVFDVVYEFFPYGYAFVVISRHLITSVVVILC